MLKKLTKNLFFFIAGQRLVINELEKRNSGKVIILMYHSVAEYYDLMGISIKPHLFEKQIYYISKYYKVISLKEAVARLKSGNLKDNYIVLTFDDGYRDNYTVAYPVLKKFKVPATIFITCEAIEKGYTDWNFMDSSILEMSKKELDLSKFGLGRIPIGTASQKQKAMINLRRQLKQMDHSIRKNTIEYITSSNFNVHKRIMLTWEEVTKLANEGLMSIGAHTLSHPILTRLSAENVRKEVSDSKKVIQEKTGVMIDFFAYPNGDVSDFDDQTVSIVKTSGFNAACTTIPGVNRIGVDPFRMRRIDVTNSICTNLFGNYSQRSFGASISGEYSFLMTRT